MASPTGDSIDIKLEDQQKINIFSKLHLKQKELNIELAKLDENRKKLEDCLEELELTDLDAVDFQFAECFIMTSTDKAKEITEGRIAEIKTAITQKSAARGDIKKNIDQLKGELYAKFGNTINLEE